MEIVSTRLVLLLSLAGLASCTFDTSNSSVGSDAPGAGLDASLPDAAPPCQSMGQGGVDVSESTLALVEGGPNRTYELSLRSKPCSIVHVTIDGGADLLLSTTTAMFSVAQWDQPQTITVAAAHDFLPEGDHTATIAQQVISSDESYNGSAVDSVTVSIVDRAHLTLVSIGLDNEGAEDHCDEAVVSDSGRYVAFTSEADNLVPDGNNNKQDIFLRDVLLGTTKRITNDSGGGGNDDSYHPAISSDGRYVVYFSLADDLTGDATSNSGEIFRYDVQAMTTTRISDSCNGCNQNLQEMGETVSISGDGNIIAYGTRRNLATGDDDGELDAYVSDGANTTLASLNSAGQNGNLSPGRGSNAQYATLSASGQFLGFRSAAGGLAGPEINNGSFHSYVKNRVTGLLTRISVYSGGALPCGSGGTLTDSSQPYISADGNLAAFDSECEFDVNDGNSYTDIFVRDMANEITVRVNESPNGDPANGESKIVGFSDDGNFVAFTSEATNLVTDDTNGQLDLFVYDRVAAKTTRASLGMQYIELSNGIEAEMAHMSRDGKYVVFTTTDQLVDADVSNDRDVYRVRLR